MRTPNMKVKCPECKEGFDLSVNDHEEDDLLQCPECTVDLVVKVKDGKFRLVTEREKYCDEDLVEEFADSEEE